MNTLASTIEKAQALVAQFPRRKARKAAVIRAYTRFERQFPQWTQCLFDKHFLTNHADGLLMEDLFGRSASITLAETWADQLQWPNPETRRQLVGQVAPVAAQFLKLLAAELRASDPVGSVVQQTT